MTETCFARTLAAVLALVTVLAMYAFPASAAENSKRVDEKTRDALVRAIEDGRAAKRYYSAVIERHGRIRPFVGILEAERRQEKTLTALCKTYGVTVPPVADSAPGPAVPDTVKDACGVAVQAEKQNVALYDEVLPSVPEGRVRKTFQNLRTASADRHLPAFERCVERDTPLPAVSNAGAPERCESCDMVGCGCSQRAQASVAAPRADAKPHGCGCMRQNQ